LCIKKYFFIDSITVYWNYSIYRVMSLNLNPDKGAKKMAIIFDIYKSHLPSGSDEIYMPRTFPDGSHDLDSITNFLSMNSAIQQADVEAVLNNLKNFLIRELSDGRSIHLGWCYLRTQVKGKFDGITEPFTHGKHSIEVSITPSAEFQKSVSQKAMPRKIDNPKTTPIPKMFKNVSLDSKESFQTDNMILMHGSYLNFDKTNPKEGVFLMAEPNLKIRVEKYSKVSSKELIFQVPQGIQAGIEYSIHVMKLYGTEIRSGKLKESVIGI
jgi:hypothetical protein